jgi:hypothetical protein
MPQGVVFAGQPAVAANSDGRLEVVVRGSDGAYWHSWQAAPSVGPWAAWSSLSGGFTGDPSVMANAGDGHLEAFGVAAGGQVEHSFFQAGIGWSAWAALGGTTFAGRVAAGRNTSGALELFVTATDGSMQHQWQTPGNGWSGWWSLGGPPVAGTGWAGSPSVTANPDGHLEVFARGPDGAIWHDWQPAWSGWWSLGGSFATDPVALLESAAPVVDVWAAGRDHLVREQWRDTANTWSAWQLRGGNV